MKAVGFTQSLPAIDPHSLIDFETPTPVPTGTDLLVEVHAVSVNPVDYRVRRNMGPANLGTRILGYDAAGVVTAVGSDCTLFKPGDAVWYAGELTRQGSNAQYQLVDERIVGRKPATLDFADAAALPLTLITAWEGLHEQLRVRHGGADAGKKLLILGGAGGVGSIMTQLAKRLGLTHQHGVAARERGAVSVGRCRSGARSHARPEGTAGRCGSSQRGPDLQLRRARRLFSDGHRNPRALWRAVHHRCAQQAGGPGPV